MNDLLHINFNAGYVLAAEDSLVQSKKLQHFFNKNKIQGVVCPNGAEALARARMEKPILIISDIMMPEMDGYSFCSHVKKDEQLNDVPFILLTSLGDPLDIIKGLQAGADNFITKPYEEDYLLTRIHYLLANRQIRQMGSGDVSIEIIFQNQKFSINSDKKQILDLLLSVYEAAVVRNEQLLQAQRELEVLNANLKSANQELDAFARTVSHDLRSPLGNILGFADILQYDYGDNLDAQANEYLKDIMTAGNKMSRLIEDLLAFSRAGRSELKREKLNLSRMAHEVVDELTKLTPQLRRCVMVEENIEVEADKGMMEIVLRNLLGNALKYTQKIETPDILLHTKEHLKRRVLCFKDNGVGFDMRNAKELFQPFVRFHKDEEYKGTGIGLSTVKRIVERHGGAIWCESEPGKGTTFFIRI